jgi:hypothetical protein
MLIYEALKKDHDEVKGLLAELVSLEDNKKGTDRRHALIEEIRDALIPHSRAEESIFYNSLRLVKAANDLAMHAYKEHMEAEVLLRVLQVRDKIDIEWKNTARELKKALEHHIREEEGEMFRAAKQLFTDEEAEMMAEAFEELKPKIREESFMKTSMDMIANLMPARFSDSVKNLFPTQKN